MESSGALHHAVAAYSWRRVCRSIERARCEERALGRKSSLLFSVCRGAGGSRGSRGSEGTEELPGVSQLSDVEGDWQTAQSPSDTRIAPKADLFFQKASRPDIHHLVLLSLHPQHGSLLPARSPGWNVGIVCFCKSTGVSKVKWHSCDGVGIRWPSCFGEEGLDVGERVWEHHYSEMLGCFLATEVQICSHLFGDREYFKQGVRTFVVFPNNKSGNFQHQDVASCWDTLRVSYWLLSS